MLVLFLGKFRLLWVKNWCKFGVMRRIVEAVYNVKHKRSNLCILKMPNIELTKVL
jgi:hypothetical protein